ncbi:hypothetical protein BT96DRAFT_1005428 [Gymnopus androsaceus JB14]|uniref:Uncharacterized protein n=1 Tax=Gymnopus androsaceus JB14 TaxID=1447944 RepID=A0A6A4GN02_9AGAR|nr:hypothetical protein BT96DRAFT_1005428 [Gymnopus androsaceus JB14]
MHPEFKSIVPTGAPIVIDISNDEDAPGTDLGVVEVPLSDNDVLNSIPVPVCSTSWCDHDLMKWPQGYHAITTDWFFIAAQNAKGTGKRMETVFYEFFEQKYIP